MLKDKMKWVLTSTVAVGIAFSTTAIPLEAHGYVKSPPSRVYNGATIERSEAKYGLALYEPQSLEAAKGFPQRGPKDGEIASAGAALGKQLDKQEKDYWLETEIKTGPLEFVWHYTAPHQTSKWHYYMTKTSWNPDKKLAREDLELIGTVNHDNKPASTKLSHIIDIPHNRSGSNIILAVWDVSNTNGAFYQVIDVNVKQK
ncbi:MAG: lytic polysaccharide monooxygenase [Culicoidibacterales bacterium]